jgi:hypothetical protein
MDETGKYWKMKPDRSLTTRLSIHKPYGYGKSIWNFHMDMDRMDIWITYGHTEKKFGLRPQHHLPGLGFTIHRQLARLVINQSTQAQLAGAGIMILACWATGIAIPTSW